MTIPPVTTASGVAGATGATAAPSAAPGFGDTISSALEAVSQSEFAADSIAESIATGGEGTVQQLMVSMAKAQINVDLLVQVRNKAVEAYQEVMRMQV